MWRAAILTFAVAAIASACGTTRPGGTADVRFATFANGSGDAELDPLPVALRLELAERLAHARGIAFELPDSPLWLAPGSAPPPRDAIIEGTLVAGSEPALRVRVRASNGHVLMDDRFALDDIPDAAQAIADALGLALPEAGVALPAPRDRRALGVWAMTIDRDVRAGKQPALPAARGDEDAWLLTQRAFALRHALRDEEAEDAVNAAIAQAPRLLSARLVRSGFPPRPGTATRHLEDAAILHDAAPRMATLAAQYRATIFVQLRAHVPDALIGGLLGAAYDDAYDRSDIAACAALGPQVNALELSADDRLELLLRVMAAQMLVGDPAAVVTAAQARQAWESTRTPHPLGRLLTRLTVVARTSTRQQASFETKTTLSEARHYLADAPTLDPNARTCTGGTALHVAADRGDLGRATELLKAGFRADTFDLRGESPLHRAARSRQLEVAAKLIAAAPLLLRSVDDQGRSALAAAVAAGHADVVKLLVDSRASTASRDAHGRTPLYEAIRMNRLDLVTLLLRGGADADTRDFGAVGPLHFALDLRRDVIARALADAGGKVDAGAVAAEMARDDTDAARIFHEGWARHPSLQPGETLLHLAARTNLWSVARWLVGQGADLTARDAQGLRPIERALVSSQSRGIIVALLRPDDAAALAWLGDQHAALRQAIAERPAMVKELGRDGLGLIHHAVRGGDRKTVELLLSLGAPIDQRTASSLPIAPEVAGWTPLHFAFALGHAELANYLMDHGASLELADYQGRSAWEMYAIGGRDLDQFPKLRERLGKDHESRDPELKHEDAPDLPTAGAILSPPPERGIVVSDHHIYIGTDSAEGLPAPDALGSDLSDRGIQLPVDLVATAILTREAYDRRTDDDTPSAGLEPMLVRCYVASGWPEAQRVARELRAARRDPDGGNPVLIALAEQNLAQIDLKLGALDAARSGFDRAALALQAAIVAQNMNPRELAPLLAAVFENRSGVARLRADWPRAIADLEAALALRDSRDAYRALPLLLLGLVHGERGRYRDAVAATTRALSFTSDAMIPALGHIGRNNLAVLFDALGDRARARQMAMLQLEALRGLDARDPIAEAVAETNAARYLRRDGDIAGATKLVVAAVERVRQARPDHELFGRMLLVRGDLAADAKDFAAAEAAYAEARTRLTASYGRDAGPVADAMRRMSLVLAERDPEAAHALLLDAWAVALRTDAPEERWPIELALARAAHARGALVSAIFFGKAAVATLEGIRRDARGLGALVERALVESRIEAWHTLAGWLVEAGRLAEAQAVLGLLKRDEVASLVTRGGELGRDTDAEDEPPEVAPTPREERIQSELTNRSVEVDKARDEVRKLERQRRERPLDRGGLGQLAEWRERLREARKAFESYLREIEAEVAQMSASRAAEIGAMNLRDLASLQSTLKELGHGAVLVQYLVGAEKLRIIVTTPELQLGHSVPIAGAALNALVFRFRGALADPRADPRPIGKELYDLLIKPIEADLRAADAATLMLSLDGVTRYLPLAALWDGGGWLVERFRLALFSTSARQHLHVPARADPAIAALGLARKVDGFSELREVPLELEGIVKRDDNDPDGVVRGQVFLDAAFSRTELQRLLEEQGHSLVHIASHFVFEPGTEADSYLVLGDGTRLTLEDVRYELSFAGVDVLSLSACNTGIGDGSAEDRHEGRELEGFAALTQRLGAKSVVATLWPVADKSTGELMRSLYAIRATNPTLTKADALRQAQLQFIRGTATLDPADLQPRGPRPPTPPSEGSPTPAAPIERAHPYYWAPFILMGNWL